jgi:SAM-dependent methyltransferase
LRVEAALTDLRESLGQAGIFLEVGARGPASTAMRQLRQAAWHYIGVDYQADANVDFVVDAHCISKHFAEASVDVIYSAEVMEHLLSPLTFVLEANRILKDGGLFVASVPTIWPLHAEPWDYWRFTSHSWKGLLNQNTGFELLYLAETSAASVVPRLPSLSGLTRMQQNPAPMQSLVLARRIGPAQPGTTGWIPGLEGGQYDHA